MLFVKDKVKRIMGNIMEKDGEDYYTRTAAALDGATELPEPVLVLLRRGARLGFKDGELGLEYKYVNFVVLFSSFDSIENIKSP